MHRHILNSKDFVAVRALPRIPGHGVHRNFMLYLSCAKNTDNRAQNVKQYASECCLTINVIVVIFRHSDHARQNTRPGKSSSGGRHQAKKNYPATSAQKPPRTGKSRHARR